MNPALIGMGSNVGSSGSVLTHALELISRLPETSVRALSPVYQTKPWGLVDQPDFLNAVVELATGLPPRELLAALQLIETQLGRVRDGERWGPRTIDLDLLVYADQVIDQPDLVVPHPHLHERAFVLVPLFDLSPSLVVPGRGRVDELLAALDDTERVGVGGALVDTIDRPVIGSATGPVIKPATRPATRRESE